ncbi:lithocholate 6-beta-hydroxylase-like [Apostichopus japonicus]|uniref:lithocholate 6-beta-hydroxylase-like n=1 Tax=Stichopus japonicus TaxID=307972 RepID=UPI003AB6CD95
MRELPRVPHRERLPSPQRKSWPMLMYFFMAGYETTNTALCLTSYLLATHPEKQDKLFEEVKKFAPRREDVSYKVLSQMEYLDCFVRESLRLFPPISVLDRINDKSDIVIKNLLIPKGFRILVPIYAIHHDPEIWEDPEEFQPERFLQSLMQEVPSSAPKMESNFNSLRGKPLIATYKIVEIGQNEQRVAFIDDGSDLSGPAC